MLEGSSGPSHDEKELYVEQAIMAYIKDLRDMRNLSEAECQLIFE